MTESVIAVIGAGPTGATCALLLARKGYTVDLYEKRADFRVAERVEAAEIDKTFGQSKDATKRSINLALSHRGQSALQACGLLDTVMSQTVEMPCRAIHSMDGALTTQQYGRPGQAIYSVSRSLINRVLVDEIDKLPNVRVYYESTVTNIDGEGVLTVKLRDGTTRTYAPQLVVGADGAYSGVRSFMLRHTRTDFHRKFIEHGYKELTIPPSVSGDYALSCPNALHIWPRNEFMMIALPNPDRSFTCTMFAPFTTFDKLDTDFSGVRPFFQTHFPDAVQLLPELERQFSTNPTSSLVEVRVKPWAYPNNRVLLLGDAAHSTVPFYGQGMNAGLEDCLFFMECIDACTGDIPKAVSKYAIERQPAGEALCDLSMGNYDEMKEKTASAWFLASKKLEAVLNSLFPQFWIPQYSMVAFTRIPYHEVIARAKRQEVLLDRGIAVGVVASLVGVVGLGAWILSRGVGSSGSGGIGKLFMNSFGASKR